MADVAMTPNVYMFNDVRCETLNIQVDLPGVRNKQDIDMAFIDDSGFYVIAKGDERSYKGAFPLPGRVDVNRALAGFADGTLTVNVPYKVAGEKINRVKID